MVRGRARERQATAAAQRDDAGSIYDHVLRAMELLPRACLALEDPANGLRAARGFRAS